MAKSNTPEALRSAKKAHTEPLRTHFLPPVDLSASDLALGRRPELKSEVLVVDPLMVRRYGGVKMWFFSGLIRFTVN